MPKRMLPQATLFYAVHQPKTVRQTVLLVHGAGSSHLTWPAALRRLPQTAVYALDLAGHGRSDLPGKQTIAAYARDVADFIGELNLKNVIGLGHSMGGAIMQHLAWTNPELLDGLILLGTGARLRVAPKILSAIAADLETAVDLLNQFYWGSQPEPRVVAANRQSMLACPAEVLLGDFHACNQFDLRQHLPEIDLPALVISSSLDQMTPPKFGEFLTEHLPQASFVLIEGAGHMMMLEAPDEIAQQVQRFLMEMASGQ